MGNKQSASSHQEQDEITTSLTSKARADDEGEPQKPVHTRTRRAKKVLRQTSVAVKKAVVSNATVTDIGSVNVASLSNDTIELILPNKGLKTVPDEVSYMHKLQLLNLCRNEISEVPSDIGSVKTLVKILLAGNLISSLPEEISALENLEELVLADNPNLSSLPSGLVQLGNMKLLNLAKCNFTQFPTVLASMIVCRYMS